MATSKLTLSIEAKTIEKAKVYAKKQHTSLSKLIQKYLQNISEKETEQSVAKSSGELPQWIKDLTLSDKPTPDFDHKTAYGKHLEEKYGL